jgi:hypothetical protein
MSNAVDRELGWDDTIENDSEFTLLPAGDYNFEVTGFERARHNGSAKLPACNKAVVSLNIDSPAGSTTIKHNLFLHTKTEGLLCQFFVGVGLRKHGEKLQMDWNRITGAKGVCQLGVHKWTNDKGQEFEGNDIKKIYDPEKLPAQPVQQPAPVQPVQQPVQTAPAGWNPDGLPF